MNEPEMKFEGTSGSEDLRGEVQSLKTALSVAILLMFVFSFCVNLFMLRQTSMLSGQAAEAQQAVDSFRENGAGQAVEFWNKMNEYARTHPDFAPIMQKYSNFINVRTNAPVAPKK